MPRWCEDQGHRYPALTRKGGPGRRWENRGLETLVEGGSFTHEAFLGQSWMLEAQT